MITSTICEKCPFLQKGSSPEDLSCSIQDISSFDYNIIPYEDEYTIAFKDKICQYKRKPNWAIKILKKKVRKEVKIKYDVVNFCKDPEYLLVNYNIFKYVSLPPRKIVCYVSNDIYKDCLNLIKDLSYNDLQISLVLNYKENRYEDVYLSGTPAHWVVFPKKIINPGVDFFNWLDEQINDYGFRFRFIDGDLSIISSFLYKTTKIPYRGIIENIPKEEKSGYFYFDKILEAYQKNKTWNLKEKKWIDNCE